MKSIYSHSIRILQPSANIFSIALLLILTCASGCAQNLAQDFANVEDCQLHILLTNDDGWDKPGIQIVRKGLLQAGHRVTTVAPLTQQSGRGGALNTHAGVEVSVIEQSDNIWTVDGTPTDSVLAALNVILADNLPDLVVSGANFGPNIAQQAAHSSGTVGAALAAHFLGYPAIALSTGLDVTERESTPPFPSTIEAFSTTAEIAVGLITRLTAQSGCAEKISSDFVLNVNVPVPASAIKGIRVTPLSKDGLFSFSWNKNSETGAISPGFVMHDINTENPSNDAEFFAAGYVTVTPINGDKTVNSNSMKNPGMLENLDQLLLQN